MDFKHALAFFWRFPSRTAKTVHLGQYMLLGGVAALDVERHDARRESDKLQPGVRGCSLTDCTCSGLHGKRYTILLTQDIYIGSRTPLPCIVNSGA